MLCQLVGHAATCRLLVASRDEKGGEPGDTLCYLTNGLSNRVQPFSRASKSLILLRKTIRNDGVRCSSHLSGTKHSLTVKQ